LPHLPLVRLLGIVFCKAAMKQYELWKVLHKQNWSGSTKLLEEAQT